MDNDDLLNLALPARDIAWRSNLYLMRPRNCRTAQRAGATRRRQRIGHSRAFRWFRRTILRRHFGASLAAARCAHLRLDGGRRAAQWRDSDTISAYPHEHTSPAVNICPRGTYVQPRASIGTGTAEILPARRRLVATVCSASARVLCCYTLALRARIGALPRYFNQFQRAPWHRSSTISPRIKATVSSL